MAKMALRAANKVMERCPACGDRQPKELVEGARKMRWVAFCLWVPCTLGLALFWPPLWYNAALEAYCPACGLTFAV